MIPALRVWHLLGARGAHQLGYAAELSLGEDGGKRFLHSHQLGVVPCICAPDQSPSVGVVDEDGVDAGPAQSFPLGLSMPSSLRVLVICTIPLPASAPSKMRLTMRDASGSGSRVGRFLGPSCPMTRL